MLRSNDSKAEEEPDALVVKLYLHIIAASVLSLYSSWRMFRTGRHRMRSSADKTPSYLQRFSQCRVKCLASSNLDRITVHVMSHVASRGTDARVSAFPRDVSKASPASLEACSAAPIDSIVRECPTRHSVEVGSISRVS